MDLKFILLEVKVKESDTVSAGIFFFLRKYNCNEAIIANKKILKKAKKD